MSRTYLALSEADKSKETSTLSVDQEMTDMHCPSVRTQNERKYVPIRTISPVALASSDVQKRKIELNRGTVVLTSSPSIKKVKEIAARKKERKKEPELRKSGIQVCRRLQLCSEDTVQKKPFKGRKDSPCLYCKEPFSISKPGESWIQYTECKVWAHCELEVQKEGKCLSVMYANESGEPRETHHLYCVMACRPKIPLLKMLLLQYK